MHTAEGNKEAGTRRSNTGGERPPLQTNSLPANTSPRELLGFIRVNICLYAAALAAIGYLLYYRPDGMLANVILSAFLGCAAAYAYNNTTDTKEDLINRKRINYFSDKPAGKWIVGLCALAGLYFASRLSMTATAAYLSFVTLLITYSAFRIKKYFLLKNIWTAIGVSQSVLIGVFAYTASVGIAKTYLTFLFLVFTGSIIADVRDIEGDKRSGISTMATRMGIARSTQAIFALLTAIAAFIIMAKITALYLLLPFAPLSAILIKKGRFAEAHTAGGLSYLALLVQLILGSNL